MQARHIVRTMVIALVVGSIPFQATPAVASDAAEAQLKRLEADRPSWLPGLDRCPADVMPAREVTSDYSLERCTVALEPCLSSCRAGNANDCYASAQVLQKVRNNPISDALFLKACELGIMSGCTNRAAGMDSGKGGSCAIRTYERACDHNDPWACTMMGMHLVRGIGIAKDHERAKQVLSRSCRYGEGDEACGLAKRLMKEAGG